MNEHEKSDRSVLPVKLPNNAAQAVAEVVEGRGLGEGNAAGTTRPGHSAGVSAISALDRVRRVAQKDRDVRFTALLHHVDVDRLRAAYWALEPKAAPGVDGVTWEDYGQGLEANLRDLHARVHRGSYRPRPSRRVYIPKADGRLRPLGVGRVGRAHCCARPPSEPCERVSPHTAQASPGGSWAGRSAGPLPWFSVWQWACIRRGLGSSDVPFFRSAVLMIALRLVPSHCSHSRGLCGGASAGSRGVPQSEQRPYCASKSRRLVVSIGRGGALRRRSAQYSARAGSSGDAPLLTIWCR